MPKWDMKYRTNSSEMTRLIVAGLSIVVVIVVGLGWYLLQSSQTVVNCGQSYDCLYQQMVNGHSAKVTVSEEVEALGLLEVSEISVRPQDNRYQVTMAIIELMKINNLNPGIKSTIGSISERCPQLVNNISSLKQTKAVCYARTPYEARTLAEDGLSDAAISQYGCTGTLIDEIKRICVTDDEPEFPITIKKPAVYLYPVRESKIHVSVNINGIISASEPEYKTGWNVTVEPGGLIDGQYDYLFYEAQLSMLELPGRGWVIAYQDLKDWFDVNLPKLGLNEKESADFIEYWMSQLSESAYYEIRLLDDEFLKNNMRLIIDPQPATMIRRNFYFRPLNSAIEIEEPVIETPVRNGFTVVEWGGMLQE